ncbi:MAG TPA: PH domain-containing protein [Marmoricola sp.]|nr:PH domain-containing protein [Marmoricola sp.]
MAIPDRLLNEGEHVVLSTRTHVKALALPTLVLVVVLGAAGYLSTLPGGAHAGTWRLVIWVVAVALLLAFTVWPFLGWLATTYTVTNRRLITRTGVVTRKGHDIPLNRISDVSYERGLVDRLLGCGSLVISDASEQGRVVLDDIPDVERVQLQISDQLFHGSRSGDDGS